MFVLGLGLGNCMQPLLLIVQSAVPPTQIGVATSSATFFRQIGGTLGVAVFLSVLFGSVGGNIADRHRGRCPDHRSGSRPSRTLPCSPTRSTSRSSRSSQNPTPDGGILGEVQDDSSIIDQMDPVLAHPFKVGFADSMEHGLPARPRVSACSPS